MSWLFDVGADSFTGTLQWELHASVACLLVTSGYTVDRAHTYVSDVSSFEVGGVGAHRILTVPGRTRTRDTVNHRIVFDCDDLAVLSLPLSAGTPKYAIFYDSTNASDATRELIGGVTLYNPKNPNQAPDTPDGSDYNLRYNAVGLWVLSTL